jgi:ubiquitin-protein ligase
MLNPVQQLRMKADRQMIDAFINTSVFADCVRLEQAANALNQEWRFALTLPAFDHGKARRLAATQLRLRLNSHYPFKAPIASLTPAVFHPNVFTSGVICLGTQWQTSEGLDLFLTRVLRLLCFDPVLINTASPANAQAAHWYRDALRQNPRQFPSRSIQ